MKYARTERERRFLLRQPPDGLPAEYRRIRDWYVDGTRLRLRRVEDPEGHVLDLKLGQKYGASVTSVGLSTTMTNLYLTTAEYERLRMLGGRAIVKRRYFYLQGERSFSINVFEETLAGLVLAEIEFDTDEAAAALPTPEFAIADVTCEAFFTGGALAGATAEELERERMRWGYRMQSCRK